MTRIPCIPCSCGFGENTSLYPHLTSGYVQKKLGEINTVSQFDDWLKSEQIYVKYYGGLLTFPKGICKSIQNKVCRKASELSIDMSTYQRNELQLSDSWLLPASDPDDIPPPAEQILHPGRTLTFTEEGDFPLGKPWDYNKEQFLEE